MDVHSTGMCAIPRSVLFVMRSIQHGPHQRVWALTWRRAVWLQIFFQYKFFLPDPIKNDVKYQASAQPFLVFGLLTTGLAIGHHTQQLMQ